MSDTFSLTPLQIAVLASAFESHERGELLAVWRSWQRAAEDLLKRFALHAEGSMPGTREIEYQNLRGHRRGKPGRRVYLYGLASGHPHIVSLARRCALAVRRKPEGRTYVTWNDVPAVAPEGRRCPACACQPGDPCTIYLQDGGEGVCVPAGMFDFERCSACMEAA